MGLSAYLEPQRIRLLTGNSKEDALRELASVLDGCMPGLTKETIFKEVWERELQLTTRVSPGIALPHAIFPGVEGTVIAVGIHKEGIIYDAREDGLVHLLVMLVGGEQSHLQALSAVALHLEIPGLYDRIVHLQDVMEIFTILTTPAKEVSTSWEARKLSKLMCEQAYLLAASLNAPVIMIHNCPASLPTLELTRGQRSGRRVIYISNEFNTFSEQPDEDCAGDELTLNIPFRGLTRSSHIEIALLLALSKGLVHAGDKVVSVFGMSMPNHLDTIVVTDVEKEFRKFLSMSVGSSPDDLEQQVFIRVLQIASEIAYEGREGKPVGTLFIVGDYQKVSTYCQQMVVNPFKGYEDHERNILDPGLAETIKEFAQIDGAFIIRGDGAIVSAGTYLRVKNPIANFPSGLGARHAAAAGITSATNAIAVVISESTRKLTLFSSGERIMEL